MQRVTNCVLIRDNEVLLLQKPRRNWWVAPGGKMERGETGIQVNDQVNRQDDEDQNIDMPFESF